MFTAVYFVTHIAFCFSVAFCCLMFNKIPKNYMIGSLCKFRSSMKSFSWSINLICISISF